MTFRHPLRNEWDSHKAAFTALALQNNHESAMARAMLAIVPAFLDFIEHERDAETPPSAMFGAVSAVAGMLIENVIESRQSAMPARAALELMLQTIHQVVAPRVTNRKGAGLIMPPRMF